MARLLFLQNMDYEFLGPMYISSMLKRQGHDCRIEIGQQLADFDQAIHDFQPDLVGFSIMSGSHPWAREMAVEVKKAHGIRNIFGGAHPTFFPQFAAEEGIDYVVRGEGEETMLEIMDRIDRNELFDEVPNVSYQHNGTLHNNALRNLRKDMDEYPYPDRQLYATLNNRLDRTVRNVITSRGCPFHCSFCFEDAMRELYAGKGKYVRIRDIPQVIEECKRLKQEADVRVIYFADDVFGMKKKWLYDFLEVYKKEVDLEFICLVRADIVASDEQYAFRLSEAGCKSVFFGVESGNEDLRNQVLKKQLTDDQIIKAADLLHRAGIKFRTYNILGLPFEHRGNIHGPQELIIHIL